jgi:membrane-bound metal-dependent hydrolase YbcI (DUF457 family)
VQDWLPFVHSRLAVTSLYYFLLISVWGYFTFFRKRPIDSTYWGMLAIGEILLLSEALLGGYMWVTGFSEPARGWLHVLYGAVIVIMLPGAYFYTQGKSTHAEAMVYGTAAIITCGLILRAIYTAQVTI